MNEQSNANHRGLLAENIRDRIEMHESHTESCRRKKIYKDESGEQWEGASKELLGKLLLYFVFHRHFSKSDQGHRQQQHPRSLPSVVLPPVIFCSFYS